VYRLSNSRNACPRLIECTFMSLQYNAQRHQNVTRSRPSWRGSGAFRFGMVLSSLRLSGCAASTLAPQPGPKDTSSAAELFRWGHEVAKQGDTARAEQYLSTALDRVFDESAPSQQLLYQEGLSCPH